MTKNSEDNNLPAVVTTAPHNKENFKGYTLKELRFHRTLVDVKRMYVKEKLVGELDDLRSMKFMPSLGAKDSVFWKVALRASRLFSYADYLTLGVSLFKTGKKIFSLFRRRK